MRNLYHRLPDYNERKVIGNQSPAFNTCPHSRCLCLIRCGRNSSQSECCTATSLLSALCLVAHSPKLKPLATLKAQHAQLWAAAAAMTAAPKLEPSATGVNSSRCSSSLQREPARTSSSQAQATVMYRKRCALL